MLGDLTQLLFNIIDKPLESKGVFLVEQLSPAIEKLEAAIAADNELRKTDPKELDEEKKLLSKLFAFGKEHFLFSNY